MGYTYDAAGNKKTQSTYIGTAATGALTGTLTYDYDADERLARVQYSAASATADESAADTIATYSYDKAGNRSALYRAGSVASGANTGVSTYYTYDALNRLTDVVNKSASGAKVVSGYHYTLDAAGKRVAMTDKVSGVITSYGYDADGRLTEESVVTASGAVTSDTVYNYDAVGNRLSRWTPCTATRPCRASRTTRTTVSPTAATSTTPTAT